MASGALVWLTGPDEPAVVARLEAPGTPARVVRRCADLAELSAAAEAGIGDLAVLHLGRGVDASRTAHLRRCGVATVLVVPGRDAPRALAIGADAVVPDGEGLGDRLVSVIAEVLARRAETNVATTGGGTADGRPFDDLGRGAGRATSIPDDPGELIHPDARLVVVWGPHGAPGRSTAALNLASELATRAPTMLVDADSFAPSLTQALGVVDETAALAALCRAAGHGTLEAATVRERARRLPSGVVLVSGLTRADRWRELAPDHLDLVWRTLRRCAAWVVVDVSGGLEAPPPRGADRWAATRSALHAADDVVLTVASDPVGVRRAVQAVAELDEAGVDAPRHLLATRVRGGRSASGGEAVAEALERFVGASPVARVPQDPVFDDALLAGASLREVDARSAARRAYVALADHLSPDTAAAPRSRARRGARLA